MSLRVVVTGAAGFMGTHLVARLVQEGFDVTGLDLRRPKHVPAECCFLLCDLLDARSLRAVFGAVNPDLVVHLAARTDLDRTAVLTDYAANTDGVRNLLAAVGEHGSVRRAICVSSQLVCRAGCEPECDTVCQPTTAYGESKAWTERIWRKADGAGTIWCIVRPTTIWGPGMRPHYVRFFRMIRKGRYFHVGPKRVLKSYGYVGNAVHQLRRLLQAPKAAIHRRVFYLADYEPVSLDEWADEFQRRLGAPPIRRIPLHVARTAALAGDLINQLGFHTYPFNSFRLRNVLTPFTVDTTDLASVCGPLPFSMQDGVETTVDWLRQSEGFRVAKFPLH